MLQLTPQTRIFLATEPVDFRKGIDGLGAVVPTATGPKPSGGRRSTSFATAPALPSNSCFMMVRAFGSV